MRRKKAEKEDEVYTDESAPPVPQIPDKYLLSADDSPRSPYDNITPAPLRISKKRPDTGRSEFGSSQSAPKTPKTPSRHVPLKTPYSNEDGLPLPRYLLSTESEPQISSPTANPMRRPLRTPFSEASLSESQSSPLPTRNATAPGLSTWNKDTSYKSPYSGKIGILDSTSSIASTSEVEDAATTSKHMRSQTLPRAASSTYSPDKDSMNKTLSEKEDSSSTASYNHSITRRDGNQRSAAFLYSPYLTPLESPPPAPYQLRVADPTVSSKYLPIMTPYSEGNGLPRASLPPVPSRLMVANPDTSRKYLPIMTPYSEEHGLPKFYSDDSPGQATYISEGRLGRSSSPGPLSSAHTKPQEASRAVSRPTARDEPSGSHVLSSRRSLPAPVSPTPSSAPSFWTMNSEERAERWLTEGTPLLPPPTTPPAPRWVPTITPYTLRPVPHSAPLNAPSPYSSRLPEASASTRTLEETPTAVKRGGGFLRVTKSLKNLFASREDDGEAEAVPQVSRPVLVAQPRPNAAVPPQPVMRPFVRPAAPSPRRPERGEVDEELLTLAQRGVARTGFAGAAGGVRRPEREMGMTVGGRAVERYRSGDRYREEEEDEWEDVEDL